MWGKLAHLSPPEYSEPVNPTPGPHKEKEREEALPAEKVVRTYSCQVGLGLLELALSSPCRLSRKGRHQGGLGWQLGPWFGPGGRHSQLGRTG